MASSKSIQKGQIPINCQLCETDKVIKWKCIECNLLMCNNCRERIHPKFRNANDHKIVDIKDIGHHNEELDFTSIKCIEHSGQFSCLFCKKCDILVCPTCVSKVHKTHANDLVEISEAYKKKIETIKKKGQSQLEDTKASMTTKKDQLDQLKTAENSKHMKVRHDILTYRKSWNEIVDNYFEKLENELDSTSKNVLESIEHDLTATIGSIQEVEKKTDEVKNFINTTNATEFFQKIKKIEKSFIVPIVETAKTYDSIPKFIPGGITESNIGMLQMNDSQSTEFSVTMVLNKTFQTDVIGICNVCPLMNFDRSIWISSTLDELVQRVKPEGNKLKVLSSFKTVVYGMTMLRSNDILLCTLGSRLKQLSVTTGKLTDTVYDVDPFQATAIHITSGNKVVVGGFADDMGKSAVFVMNEKGEHETVFERNQHLPAFNYPWNITSTRNGNIHVVDNHQRCDRRKVVICGQGGGVVNTYYGHSVVNKEEYSFLPFGIVTTKRDVVIVADMDTHTLHMLNNAGRLMTYQNINKIGIQYPFSLAFTPTGKLYIGCDTECSTRKRVKLYEVTIIGC
ncbi:uncharacterized protein LOC143070938 [Mytilus galloprovincialis]|uniref:uncharacterized protein LOC143070938 n=1 Tax=Mytilus galloprovincialis TaxID=29158 RepID=UPI003F7C35C6